MKAIRDFSLRLGISTVETREFERGEKRRKFLPIPLTDDAILKECGSAWTRPPAKLWWKLSAKSYLPISCSGAVSASASGIDRCYNLAPSPVWKNCGILTCMPYGVLKFQRDLSLLGSNLASVGVL